MTAGQNWTYQVRINLAGAFAQAARGDMDDPSLKPLKDVLTKYNAAIKNQFDAFADFCKDAEAKGETDTALYRWTRATINLPNTEQKYATRFTIYADGGQETYDKAFADALAADLKPLVASGMITKLDTFDSDPAKNPQAPAKYRR